MEKNPSTKGTIKHATAIALGAAAFSSLLTGCSQTRPSTELPATVVSHEYDDQDIWFSYVSTGKVIVPIMHVDPEHYYLNAEQCGRNDATNADENGCVEFTHEVDSTTYQNMRDGDTFQYVANPKNGRPEPHFS